MRLRWSIALGLVVATFAVYFQVRHHVLLQYDDGLYFLRFSGDLGPNPLRRLFTAPLLGNWTPLTWLSWMVDHSLYGDAPAGYLLTNVAWHAASSVLLFFAFVRMTGAVWPSAFVAAVFALHPLHVESVAWMSERKDVLSGFFFSATLLAYAGFNARRTLARYGLVALCLALGLLAKPTLVTLPFVLLLLDYWPLGRLRRPGRGLPGALPLRRAVLEKLPLFVLSAGASAATLAFQHGRGFVAGEELFSLGVRLANAAEAYGFYLAKTVWPAGLAVVYPHAGDALPRPWTAAAALGLAAITLLVTRQAARRPCLVVGWLWFLGTLVPMIGLVQVGTQAAADRYMYLPLIGLASMPAFVAAEWSGPRRLAAAATGAVCVAAFAVVSVQQVRHWRDTAALFEHAIAVTAENAHAQAILGAAYQRQGRLEEASVHLSEAVRLRPAWAKPRVRLADVEAARQRWAEAVPHYEQALRSQPRHARARINLAQALIRLGRFELARRQLERVLTAGRHVSAVYRLSLHRGLARTAWERGEPGEAIEHYRLALEVRPNDAVAHAGLGLTLARTGRGDEARAHLTAIPGDWPANSAEVRAARVAAAVTSGVALPEESPPREQRSDFRYVDDHRAWILATSANPAVRDPDEAIALMEQALREGVANPLRLDTLAAGYAAAGRFPDAIRAATRAERAAAEPALARQIRARLALYRARTAYLETPPDG